jgi:SPP1 gp7 family putative phage head morphogenesis protein
MNVLERYNAFLRTTEDGTITLLNRVLDQAFNRLVRRTRIHLRAGYVDPAQRNLALLQEFRQLIPAYRPDRVDAYDRLLRNLTADASARGLDVADQLTQQMAPTRERIDVSIPLEATTAAAAQARGFLKKHGDKFALDSAEVVSRGILEGRPTDSVVRDMRLRLGIVKSRAETIVRTESIRAYAEASNQYYSAQGIEFVSVYVAADERACPVCSSRAGLIYKRGSIKVPFHPRCRCFLSPWDSALASIDIDYAKAPSRHREEVKRYVPHPLSDQLQRSVFEAQAPVPVQ